MAIKSEPDWYRIKFLESTSNIKRALKESVGREPSTRIAREISTCLQQGRMFFEAAIQSPIEIRPLLIFYGIIGFSKAVILARHQRGHETLLKPHGLKDISPENGDQASDAIHQGAGAADFAHGDGRTHPGRHAVILLAPLTAASLIRYARQIFLEL